MSKSNHVDCGKPRKHVKRTRCNVVEKSTRIFVYAWLELNNLLLLGKFLVNVSEAIETMLIIERMNMVCFEETLSHG